MTFLNTADQYSSRINTEEVLFLCVKTIVVEIMFYFENLRKIFWGYPF